MKTKAKFKYKLIYWDNIIYFVSLKDARKFRDSLPYYQQEDSMILRIKDGDEPPISFSGEDRY